MWKTVRGDLAGTAGVGESPGGSGRLVWTNPLPDPRTRLVSGDGESDPARVSTMAAGLGHVFAIARYDAGKRVVCLDPENGEEAWSTGYTKDQWTGYAPPVVGEHYLAVGRSGHSPDLVALDPATGALQWETELVDVSHPTLAADDGRFYIASPDRTVAVDERSGEQLWSARTKPPVDPRISIPTSRGLVHANGWQIACLDRATGERGWTWQTETSEPLSGAAVVDETVLLYSDRLRALDLVDGTERWQWDPAGETGLDPEAVDCYAGPIVAGDGALLALEEGRRERLRADRPARSALVSIDVGTGETRWISRSSFTSGVEAACLSGNHLFTCGAGQARCVDLSRQRQRWATQIPPTVRPSPADAAQRCPSLVSDGLLLVGTNGAGVLALDAGGDGG